MWRVQPFYHIYGFTVILNIALCAGARVVTMPGFDPALFLKVLKQYDVTVAHVAPPRAFLPLPLPLARWPLPHLVRPALFALPLLCSPTHPPCVCAPRLPLADPATTLCATTHSPPVVGFLAKHPAVDSVLPLPRLKELFSGAAPLGQELEDAARSRLGCIVRQGYGMTEAAPATHIVPYDVAASGVAKQTVGTLVPGMECKIINTENGEECAVGERGELCLAGPNIMVGYLNKPEATADSFDADGFYKTGDVGFVDEDGLYYVVDRVKELIKVKGYQVRRAPSHRLSPPHALPPPHAFATPSLRCPRRS